MASPKYVRRNIFSQNREGQFNCLLYYGLRDTSKRISNSFCSPKVNTKWRPNLRIP